MATQKYQVVEVRSDISDEVGAETLQYSVGNTKYAIDLTEAEMKEFHEALAPYISVSRVKGGASASSGGGDSKKAKAEEVAKIREWAAEAGYDLSPTGRIPNDVRAEYEAAHKGTQRRARAS